VENFLRLENRHTGEILKLRKIRDANGEVILLLDGTLPARSSGPPLHVHYHQREEGVIKAGTLGAQVGNETVALKAGASAVFEAGVVHRWWNAGDDLLEFSGRSVPAVDLDQYLQGVFAVLNAGAKDRPPLFYIAHVAWRHRHTQAIHIPPRIVQAILFPLVILVGRILGKYRGREWPGSPQTCTGAPLEEAAGA
jgi:mannose-6-phosphate isomerase-like protein (cupin superfamily)